jgi:hypothetical protein
MVQPDFFLAAAPRSGTTSVFNYLLQHPRIAMSRKKEPAYFHFAYPRPDFAELAREHGPGHLSESIGHYDRTRSVAVTEQQEYDNLWPEQDSASILGEATPTYMYDANALDLIRKSNPTAKLILLLRNPVDRAYSQYLQYLRHGFESIYHFEEALKQEPVEIEAFWWGQRRYRRMGLYAAHVERCMNSFADGNVGVFLYEDLAVRPHRTVEAIVRFLGIDDPFAFDTSAQYKAAFVPAPSFAVRMAHSEGVLKRTARTLLPSRLRNRVYRHLVYRQSIDPPALQPETRRALIDFFLPDVVRLEGLLGRELSSWKAD